MKNQKRKERRIKKQLMDSLERSAFGYFITKEKIVKLKTCKEIDGKIVKVEEIKVVPLKKYIPPNRKAREELTRIYQNQKPKHEVLEVIFCGESKPDYADL